MSEQSTEMIDSKSQLDLLLADKDFRLIKVELKKGYYSDEEKEINSLMVVTPALDPEIARDVKETGWCCLSHLWGPPDDWVEWDNIKVVDGNSGNTIKAKGNPDQASQIIKLLRENAVYWWIDVFCAQTDTPLVIMGDIYQFCSRCAVLLDCPRETFKNRNFWPLIDAIDYCVENIGWCADYYQSAVTKVIWDPDEYFSYGWFQVLRTILDFAEANDNLGDRALKYFKKHYASTPASLLFLDTLEKYGDDMRFSMSEIFMWKAGEEYGPDEFDAVFRLSLYNLLERFSTSFRPKYIQYLADFLDCKWMNRVWTLQEAALPKTSWLPRESYFVAGLPSDEETTFQGWAERFGKLLKIVQGAYVEQIEKSRAAKTDEMRTVQPPRKIMDYYDRQDPTLGRIYSDYRKLLEPAITLSYRPDESTDNDFARRIILNTFATSQRTALYPVDYVYGVLGILNIDIPRLEDPKEIWQIFSSELRARYPDLYVPEDVDLANATKMEDVYGEFGFTFENSPSSAVIDYIIRSSQ